MGDAFYQPFRMATAGAIKSVIIPAIHKNSQQPHLTTTTTPRDSRWHQSGVTQRPGGLYETLRKYCERIKNQRKRRGRREEGVEEGGESDDGEEVEMSLVSCIPIWLSFLEEFQESEGNPGLHSGGEDSARISAGTTSIREAQQHHQHQLPQQRG